MAAGFGRHGMPPPACNPDVETGMRVASKVGWGTFLPNLGTLGLWILELFAMYTTDGQTDGQKQRLLPPTLRSGA